MYLFRVFRNINIHVLLYIAPFWICIHKSIVIPTQPTRKKKKKKKRKHKLNE